MQLSLSEYLIMGRQSERCRLTIEREREGEERVANGNGKMQPK